LKRMRITVVTGPFDSLPPAGCGAAERIWARLGTVFAAQDHSVTMVCRGESGRSSVDQLGPAIRQIHGPRLDRSRRRLLNLVQELGYTLRILPRLPLADVIVSNTVWLPALAPRLRPDAGKLVAILHRLPKGQLRLYGRAARLIAPSSAVRDAVVRERPSLSPRVRQIPCPIDTEVFAPRPRVRGGSGRPTAIYTGRIHSEKGLELLVEGVRLARERVFELHLRLVGPWQIEHGGEGGGYRDRLRRSGAGFVEVIGPIHEPALLAAELHKGEVFVYPSLAENGESFGVAPLEAMGTGLPTVVSDLPCFREYVEPGVSGLVFDHRGSKAARHLASALVRVLGSPELASSLGRAAAERAAAFSYTRIAERFLDEFRDITLPA
jgi:glycosyltransferase involved in cell wall biosynthesis